MIALFTNFPMARGLVEDIGHSMYASGRSDSEPCHGKL
jgi:hypothetical protein